MSGGLHLSVRVPWHDSGWAGTVCNRPLDNTSCVLLKNIGEHREDEYEATHADKPLDLVNPNRVPCVSERGSFMSPHSYQLTKEHPYRFTSALKGRLQPTPVTVPAYGVHATPYFWLHRDNVAEVLRATDVEYREELEELVNDTLKFKPQWIIHGDNQRALITRFFADVEPGNGLVFFYLKHSPFTAAGTSGGRSLLVGAARITDIDLPSAWKTTGSTPFPNHMWETNVRHSLRPDGKEGVLLPMAELAALDLDPEELGDALAWAPEYGSREFMYVTEHVSDDTAIAALERLYRAAERCMDLGLDVPRVSMDWLSERIAELWTMRGPAPGLGAVLEALSVPHGPVVARAIARQTPEGVDPWDFLGQAMEEPAKLGPELAKKLSGTPRKVWRKLPDEKLRFLKLLTRFNLTVAQADALLTGGTEIDLSHEELLEDPYHAYTCLLGGPAEVAFDVIDRGCFPEASVRAAFPLDEPSAMVDAADERRVQALLTAVAEEAAAYGDTVVPLGRMLDVIKERPLVEPCPLTEEVLEAHELHPSDLSYDEESPYWPPVCGTALADGSPAFKLTRLETTSRMIRVTVDEQLARTRHQVPGDVRAVLDGALPTYNPQADDIAAEDRARTEKTAALTELFAAPLSVLNGRAGTGKTTLIHALANQPDVNSAGVLLLAPTGKARVQLTKKVKLPAQTLAQFLGKYGRYDRDTGTYLIDSSRPKAPRFGTVIVDESSMLTEEQLAALLDALRPPDRLILVGDPRQLPPIGAGRPFVDLIARLTSKASVPAFPRVAPGYAELTVLRRQSGQVRDDLMLAGWFAGDEIPEGFDEVWHRLRKGAEMKTLAARPWQAARPEQAIDAALAEELDISGPKAAAKFELSYGGRENGPWVNFPTGEDGAGARSEAWQILSPTRTNPWGTIEVNRRLKRKYRGKALKDALRPPYERTVPAPIGAEQIVLGDKVLNNQNQSRKAWPVVPDALNYVANGEIGVVVGQISKKGSPPKYTHIEFSSQVGSRYSYSSSNEDDPALELAWAITVHKAQGSEFGKVFVLLPGSSRWLSRELLYTALTRQKEKVVLLHERPIEELFELTRSTGSETARRLTDLFAAPAPREVLLPDGTTAGVLDTNLIHVTSTGILVRSKNEVIIAGILEDLVPGGWEYEKPFFAGELIRFPDFTIVGSDGRPVYWEHLGMLGNPHYEAAWEAKLAWYRDEGVLPHGEGGGPKGTLIWTDDRDGVDVPAWTELAKSVLGTGPSGVRVPARRAAKKAAPAAARSPN